MRFKRKLTRLFIKTFSVTVIAIIIVFGAGWLTLQKISEPPVIESNRGEVLAAETDPADPNAATGGEAEPAHISAEQHPEDEKIGGGSVHPASVTSSERKPEFYTFLIFGTDGGINTDTIMVGAYDGIAGKAYVIAVPRDTKVNVQRKAKKINSAYQVGTLHGGGHEGGVNQLRREIRTLIGFVPDFYVSVNFDAFIELVDAVDGVEVNVPYDMSYDDIYQDLSVHFNEGLQVLSGREALEFARHRQNNEEYAPGKWRITKTFTDYQRIENQQQVIRAVMNKVLQPANIIKIPAFMDIFNEHVKTDVTNVIWFGEELISFKDKTDILETYTLPITGTTGKPDWYELPDEPEILALVNKTINPYLEDIKAGDLSLAS